MRPGTPQRQKELEYKQSFFLVFIRSLVYSFYQEKSKTINYSFIVHSHCLYSDHSPHRQFHPKKLFYLNSNLDLSFLFVQTRLDPHNWVESEESRCRGKGRFTDE